MILDINKEISGSVDHTYKCIYNSRGDQAILPRRRGRDTVGFAHAIRKSVPMVK